MWPKVISRTPQGTLICSTGSRMRVGVAKGFVGLRTIGDALASESTSTGRYARMHWDQKCSNGEEPGLRGR